MNNCVIDGKPTDSRLCGPCWSNFEVGLKQVPWLVDELRAVLTRSTKYSGGGVGWLPRTSDEQPLVLDLRASALADELRVTLGTWVRALHQESCIRWEECHVCSARWFGGDRHHTRRDCHGEWIEMFDPLVVHDNSVELAAWILRHQSWVRNHPAVDELVEQIIDVIRSVWRSIDVEPGKQFAGVCGAPTEDGSNCLELLWARSDRSSTTCRACGARHEVEDRRAGLLLSMEDELVPVGALVGLVNYLGRNVTSDVISGMKRRGRIVPKVFDNGVIRLRVLSDAGPDTYRLGDVLDALARRYERVESVTCAEPNPTVA